MQQRSLGTSGPVSSAIGLGCMGMSGAYGPSDEAESIGTIHAALDAGITLLDTGDYYGMGHNELLIRDALRGFNRDRVLLSVKFGALRDPAGPYIGVDTRPAAVRNYVAYTLKRLGTDYIDIYRPGRLDPAVPIEETIGAVADLVKRGYVRYAGLSEVGADTLRRAHATHPISDLQIEYSLISRSLEAEVLPAARELGIGITAYGVLSRGLIGGAIGKGHTFAKGDFRALLPRFSSDNLERNLTAIDALAAVASARGVTVAQLAIAWVLSRGKDIVPLIGTRRRDQLQEAVSALELTLSPGELAAIEAALPASAIAGTRYDSHQMKALDSEKTQSAS
jgi:aryl-alcohol dehydrogenase-like predicted oxidoreductase